VWTDEDGNELDFERDVKPYLKSSGGGSNRQGTEKPIDYRVFMVENVVAVFSRSFFKKLV
ncbi:MAG: hypothetical protein ACRDFB_00370, partial [Rhabdochlamydiaceae bacterium]